MNEQKIAKIYILLKIPLEIAFHAIFWTIKYAYSCLRFGILNFYSILTLRGLIAC